MLTQCTEQHTASMTQHVVNNVKHYARAQSIVRGVMSLASLSICKAFEAAAKQRRSLQFPARWLRGCQSRRSFVWQSRHTASPPACRGSWSCRGSRHRSGGFASVSTLYKQCHKVFLSNLPGSFLAVHGMLHLRRCWEGHQLRHREHGRPHNWYLLAACCAGSVSR